MKKLSLALLGLCIFLMSCKKDSSNSCPYTESSFVATSAEISYLQNYITTNSITAVQHPSGIFYTINLPGSDPKPNVCSNVSVKYVGKLLNGNQFDASTGAGITFALGQVIVGWQKGVPLIGAGGTITLYIPPSLAYGNVTKTDVNGNVVIPANSYLKFDIQLVAVQ
ncbi:MAG: FKBP-type peptidylprolyl isomerase [Ferruginibacter sp.]|nr:FKBP-type peptidylprolyl isomerase [Ferruginibacter sp.]